MRSCLRPTCALKRRCVAALAGLAIIVSPLPALAAGKPYEASTSESARDEARRSVPLERVDPAYRDAVRDVLANPSLFRRMPTNVVDCRPEMFTFLAQNPEVLVEIWRHLGLSKVELTRTSENTFQLRDNAGTTGKLVIVEQQCDAGAQNRIVMFAEGQYDGKPFQRSVAAQCVLSLRSGSVRETNGRQYVAARLDSFIKLDRASMELLAQAVHPFVGRTADRNFADTMSFVSNLSYTSEKHPQTIERIASELNGVTPSNRQRLVDLAAQAALDGAEWEESRAQQAAVVDISPR